MTMWGARREEDLLLSLLLLSQQCARHWLAMDHCCLCPFLLTPAPHIYLMPFYGQDCWGDMNFSYPSLEKQRK